MVDVVMVPAAAAAAAPAPEEDGDADARVARRAVAALVAEAPSGQQQQIVRQTRRARIRTSPKKEARTGTRIEVRLRSRISELKGKLANQAMMLRAARRDARAKGKALEAAESKVAAHDSCVAAMTSRRDGRQRYFSGKGGLFLAAKRALSNAAAQSIGLTMGVDCHGTTVARWEITLRATMVAAFRFWQRGHEDDMDNVAPWECGGFRLRFRRIRCDATNTGVYKKAKLHVNEVMLGYITRPVRRETPWPAILEEFNGNCRTILGDLQMIRGTDTGVGMVGMLEKQLSASGVPSWADDAVPLGSALPLADALAAGDAAAADALAVGDAAASDAPAPAGVPVPVAHAPAAAPDSPCGPAAEQRAAPASPLSPHARDVQRDRVWRRSVPGAPPRPAPLPPPAEFPPQEARHHHHAISIHQCDSMSSS